MNINSLSDPMVKLVTDLEQRIISIGCELHIDCADELLANGSKSADLWGANIFPAEKRVDYVSMINIRPQDNNRSMEIKLPDIQTRVEEIIKLWIIF